MKPVALLQQTFIIRVACDYPPNPKNENIPDTIQPANIKLHTHSVITAVNEKYVISNIL